MCGFLLLVGSRVVPEVHSSPVLKEERLEEVLELSLLNCLDRSYVFVLAIENVVLADDRIRVMPLADFAQVLVSAFQLHEH